MRSPLLWIIVLSLITVSVCYPSPPCREGAAASALERIRTSPPPDALRGEYLSIVDTFRRAEGLRERNRPDDAEKLYLLVTQKIYLYEKNLASLQAGTETASSPEPSVEDRKEEPPSPLPPVDLRQPDSQLPPAVTESGRSALESRAPPITTDEFMKLVAVPGQPTFENPEPPAIASRTGKITLPSVGEKPASDIPLLPEEEREAYFTLDFRGYVEEALKTNPSHLMDRQEFNRYYLSYMADLQAYGFNVSLSPYGTVYYDEGTQYGADLKFDISKILYDGGKRGVLEKEMDIVTLLSRADLIESRNKTILIAANYYSTFYYAQQEIALLKRNFEEYTEFMQGVESSYRKGIRFSSYDYYSVKSQYLLLERDLLRRKSALLKAEAAFRQFGGIETKRPIRLIPLSVSPPLSLEEYQVAAVTDNSAIGAARLRKDLQLRKIEEREAEGGLSVTLDSSLGVQIGSSDYTGSSTTFGSGSKPIANVGITASIPLFDGGVRKTRVMMEEIDALKQKLLLRKTTEDIVMKLTELYTDYRALEKDLEISAELTELNGKRLRIARERFEKGLEEYRAVREAWNDSLLSEMETIRERVVLRKTLTDLSILSGKNVVGVCREN